MFRKALIGNGGHAKEVMAQIGETMVRFVGDEYYVSGDPLVLPMSKFSPDDFQIMIAVGESHMRSKIESKLPKNTRYFSYIHPTAQIMGNCKLGEGYFIGANCILTCDIQIGNHAILNRGNQIGHDCVIGDFFSAMPGSIVSGNVHIGNRVYLGTNSSIIEKKYLLHDIKIGANSVVISDIKNPGTYAGTPVKEIRN